MGELMNNRRKLFVALCARALTTSLESFAQQQAKIPRIGFLDPGTRDSGLNSAFLPAMQELGYVVGKNIAIENGPVDVPWRFTI